MLTFLSKKIILFVLVILFTNNYCHANGQGDVVSSLKPGTIMFLKMGFNNLKEGQLVVILRAQGSDKYLTNLGLIDRSILETQKEREQWRQNTEAAATDQTDQASDKYTLVLNNAADCKIEFSPPHENLSYVDNMSLELGEYDISISKRLYFPLSVHLRMDSDVTFDLKMESIFTNYGGGYIDELIKNGEIRLDEEFDGKTLLHLLIESFSKKHSSFSFTYGSYEGSPKNAPIGDLLNSIQYFIAEGFDINKPDSNGKTLLTNVIKQAPAEVVSLLLENGAKIQPEYINAKNDYAGIFPPVGGLYGVKWSEKVLHIFPEDLLTEILEHEVSKFFTPDGRLVKLLVEGGAYPFVAFDMSDKEIKEKISGRIVLVQGESETHAYLKWATENYAKIKQWKEKQQISFKLSRGEFADIKDYTDSHPDSLQYITDEKLKIFLLGPKELTVREIADRIAQGVNEDELLGLIGGNEDEYADSFTTEQKQYMLDAGLSARLVGFLEEHTRQVKIIKKEERAMLAMLKQEDERRAATAETERQAQIKEQKRAEGENKKQKRELFGKILALGAGAVIANSAPLDSVKKTEFLTNYATDVLTDNKSMSNTQQWANAAGQSSAQTASGGGGDELSRNKQISSSCKQQSNSYDDGDGQTTSHCRTAIYNECVADEMCSLYPSKCGALRARVTTSCAMMAKMGFNGCSPCN